ncbi:CFEM domain-containing protein [Emericellopsis atlantica]|uniref:CFEM domain-containing protein n=1 Tax=Emericellopsis atlantica TaxID=2614577 RepID=A0A9P7ZG96_9HYPO|nr:CFEM domain-containing protein [Emericellopsis atlantica]KAG9251573.1 CFEM domain-containing protein [Emericellopsis atlantica]
MQVQIIAAAFLATLCAAQDAPDLEGLPECAQPCFVDNVPISGCDDASDFACLCGSSEYINTVTTCVLVESGCSLTVALEARGWAEDTCEEAGVPI